MYKTKNCNKSIYSIASFNKTVQFSVKAKDRRQTVATDCSLCSNPFPAQMKQCQNSHIVFSDKGYIVFYITDLM